MSSTRIRTLMQMLTLVLTPALVVGVTSAVLVTAPVSPAEAMTFVPSDLPPPQGDASNPQEARDRADEITSRSEYQPPEKSLLQRFFEEFQKLFARVSRALSGGGAGSAFGWICLLAMVGGVGFLLYRVGRTVQRSPEQQPEVTIEVHRSPTEWRSEAERFESKGEWKEALRCRYRAMVTDLVDREVLPDVPGRTVGEHRGDVRASVPEASPDFSGAAELFERAWYGNLPTGQDENRQFRELSGRVLEKASP